MFSTNLKKRLEVLLEVYINPALCIVAKNFGLRLRNKKQANKYNEFPISGNELYRVLFFFIILNFYE